MQTLLLTCVHYHNEDQVRQFVDATRSLETPPGWRLEFAIADNSASWSGRPLPVGATVVAPPRNLGYLGGCNAAYTAWRAARGQPDLLGIVNTDLAFAPDFFRRLLTLRVGDQVGVVAPNVVLPNGARQNPFMRQRPPWLGLQLYMRVWRVPPLSRVWDLGFELKRRLDGLLGSWLPAPREPVVIYAPHGSAVFVRPRLLRTIDLDFRGFMYFEELHFAEQARRAGLEVLWVPGLVVRHQEHTITGSVEARRRWSWKHQSTKAILEDYFR